MSKKINYILLFFAIFLYCSVYSQKPEWLENRPVNNHFYIGIGSSKKVNNSYSKIARENALSEISSEISITIRSNSFNKVIESKNVFEKEFISMIHSSSDAELEGYELIDTYEDENYYYVYYRLSKDYYKKWINERYKEIAILPLSFYHQSIESYQNGDISKALDYRFRSIAALEDNIDKPITINQNGERVPLLSLLISSIDTILSNINISGKNKYYVDFGTQQDTDLCIVFSSSIQSKLYPVYSLPVCLEVLKGKLELQPEETTNIKGETCIKLFRVKAKDKVQIVRVKIDTNHYSNYFKNEGIKKFLLSSFNFPSFSLYFNVNALKFCAISKEINLGRRIEKKIVKPSIIMKLIDHGFEYTKDTSNYDYKIVIDSRSEKGTNFQGIHTAFASSSLLIYNQQMEPVYKNHLESIRGGDINFERAGLDALNNISDVLSNEIIEFIHE